MTASKDARALILSVVASSVFAVGSLIWGLLAGSQMIVFDGLYSFVSVALSLLAATVSPLGPIGASIGIEWIRHRERRSAIT